MSLIDKRVKFSIDKNTFAFGQVVDKVLMTNSRHDAASITGYLIETEIDGELMQIQHWRLMAVVPGDHQLGVVQGGFDRETAISA